MFDIKVQEIKDLMAQVAAKQQELDAQRQAELSGLPAKYGYANASEFVAAVKAACGEAPARPGRKPKAAKASKAPKAKKEKKAKTPKEKKARAKRATITPELREKIIEAAKANKTGAEISKEFSVSVPTVQNIKKAAGLVKARE